jgi:chemotaxis protein MotB
MRRRKKSEEHVHHDRWLVSYADFITLLFAFFVVLYSTSQIDKQKAGLLALSIQMAFQQLGVFNPSSTENPINDVQTVALSKAGVTENPDYTIDLGRFVLPVQTPPRPSAQPDGDMEAELHNALALEIKNRIVDVHQSDEGIVVSLREIGFYDSGSSRLRPSSKEAIDRLVKVLYQHPNALRVEGHTDNIPIHTVQFDSNWELSTARASEFVKLLIERYRFAPGRLSAAGFAEFHPVSPNQTEEGRGHNRRVDIVILKVSSFRSAATQLPSRRP